MLTRLVDWLIARAKRTPYFHLPGRTVRYYMHRWWLVPYVPSEDDHEYAHGLYTAHWRKNPFVWLCQRFDIGIRVHQINESDARGDPHDHPWPYLSIVLRGGYTEVQYRRTENGLGVEEFARVRRSRGSIVFRCATDFHRVELPIDLGFNVPTGKVVAFAQPCTTLFITFRYRQRWGYVDSVGRKRYYRDVHADAAAKLPELK